MKNRIGLYFAMAGSLVLTGCSLESPAENFYRVDFYTDYVGFDEDYEAGSLDYTKANLIGHAYAKKEKVTVSDEAEEITYYGVSEPTKLEGDDATANYKESTREAPEGHSWVFDGWVGFYDDGTVIDLKHIKEDCRVFAHYKDQKQSYVVTIDGYSSERLSYRVPYGEKLADQEAYQAEALTADPTHKYNDRYFETSALSGLKVTVGDEDASSLVPEQSVTPFVTTIANWEITNTTKFEFVYSDAVKKQYTVTFDCQDEDGNTIQASAQAFITYGEELPLPEIGGYTYIRSSGEYSEAAKALDSSLAEVDVNHIFYDATVTLIYRRKAVERKVYVYDDTGAVIQNADNPVIAYDGKIPSMPAPTLTDGKIFTGKWVVFGTGALFDPEQTLQVAEISVVPVSINASCVKDISLINHTSGTNVPASIEFSFRRDLQGFVVSALNDSSAPLDAEYHISAADLTYSATATYALAGMAFNTVGIQAFGGSSITQKIYELDVPTSIKELAGTSLRGMANLNSLDLSACAELTSIGDYAFEACSSLSHIQLPASLSYLGSRAFSRCASLTDVDLSSSALTEIKDYTFEYCTSLTDVMLSNSITKIGDHAFENCTSLAQIPLSTNVREIGASAFEKSGLTSIDIPTGVTSIGAYSFRNCSNLADIHLPATLVNVGSKIVYGSMLLTATGNGISVNLSASAVAGKITARTWSGDWLELDDQASPTLANVNYAS